MGPGDPVQEDETVKVVKLVEHGTGFERVDTQRARLTVWADPAHRELCRPGHLAGEIWDRHATFPGNLRRPFDDHCRIEKYERPMAGARLSVPCDIDGECPEPDPDLGRGKPDACR